MTAVLIPATASPYRACLPTVAQFTPERIPSCIWDSWASSDEPGMNSICIAVLRIAMRIRFERSTVWMMVRVTATRVTALQGEKNASAAAIASSIIMKMNMISAWRRR